MQGFLYYILLQLRLKLMLEHKTIHFYWYKCVYISLSDLMSITIVDCKGFEVCVNEDIASL